jgi:hypothetical protein
MTEQASRRQHHRQRPPPRRCIFCGQGGGADNPISGEHLWPCWMHPYLPKLSNPKKDERYRAARLITGTGTSSATIRQGHVFTRRFRVVCKRCNETWMKAIEEDVKITFIPLLQGQHMKLLVNNRRKLAEWITLKTMVVDGEEPSDTVFTSTARTSVKDRREMPKLLKIWISHHDDHTWYSGLQHQSMRATPPHSTSLAPGKNVMTTAIGLGHLFIFVFYSVVPDVQLKMNIGAIFPRRVIQIWPLRYQNIVWPPPALSNSEPDRLGNILKEFTASSLARFPSP